MLPCGQGGTTHLLQAGGIQLSFVYNLHGHLGETETRGEGVMREKFTSPASTRQCILKGLIRYFGYFFFITAVSVL